jgi:hypothetical protein
MPAAQAAHRDHPPWTLDQVTPLSHVCWAIFGRALQQRGTSFDNLVGPN